MQYLEKYDFWMENVDEAGKKELLKMSDNDKKEAFTNDLEFGTGGMRGILGLGTNRMNAYIIRKVTLGFARYIKSLNTDKSGVVIAHDNRHFSTEFSLEAAKVLASEGIKVYLFDGLRPTPELSFAIRHKKARAGIMITASHNPKEYNGYKIYDEDGCQLTTEAANKVIDEINKIENYFSIETKKNSELIFMVGKEIDDAFRALINTLPINKNYKKDFKIVYTPLHGTGGVHVPDVLRMNGYDVTPVEKQMINDPDFSSVKSANPEEKDAFIEAINLGHKINAILLLATDPDADRMGVATLHNNEYVLLNGNQTGAVILNYLLKFKAQKNDCVFSTIVSSPMVVDMAKKMGLYTKSVLTGFKFIGEQIKLIEGTDKRYLFGYEESYGCLLTDQMRDKDSVGACLLLSEIAAYYNEKNMSLVDALDEIYEEYGYYLESLKNIGLKGLEGSKKINEIMEYFRNNELEIKGIVSKLDYKKGVDDLPKSNVLKYELDNDSWFVLRPSGTEPKIKIYYGVKGTSHKDANNRMNELKALVEKEINKVL